MNVLCIDGPLAGKSYETVNNFFVVRKQPDFRIDAYWTTDPSQPVKYREYVYRIHHYAFVDGDERFIIKIASYRPRPNFQTVLRFMLSPKARKAGEYERG